MKKPALLAVLALTLSSFDGCTVELTRFAVPAAVRAGAVFEVMVETEIAGSFGGSGIGAVLQVPHGCEVLGAWHPFMSMVPLTGIARDDPFLLAAFQAEPGYVLHAFSNDDPSSSAFPRAPLRLRVRAPGQAGTHLVKVALAIREGGLWTPHEPSGQGDFASIGGDHAVALEVTPAPFVGSTAWEDRSEGLPVHLPTTYRSVTHADVDHDGRLDVAATLSFGDLPFVALQRGASWVPSEPASSRDPLTITEVRFARLDGDPHVDLVCGGSAWLGDGAGGWTPAHDGLEPLDRVGSIAVGDVNGDGLDDLALSGSPTGTALGSLQVFLSDGDGTWSESSVGLPTTAPFDVPEGGSGLELADLDGDGHLDIVWGRSLAPAIWLGNGGTSWTELSASTLPAYSLYEVLPADLDGDGNVDLVMSVSAQGPPVYGSGGVRVLLQTAPLEFTEVGAAGPGDTGTVPALALADLDGDGVLDLATAPYGNDDLEVELWLGDGDGTFTRAPDAWNHGLTFRSSMGTESLALADVNGDGLPDLTTGFVLRGLKHLRNEGAGVELATRRPAMLGTTLELDLVSRRDAGLAYVCALSLGVHPGISLKDDRSVPLAPDMLFLRTVLPGNPSLLGNWGVLDGDGRATVRAQLPSRADLAGLEFFAAFVTLGPPGRGRARTISPALPLTLR